MNKKYIKPEISDLRLFSAKAYGPEGSCSVGVEAGYCSTGSSVISAGTPCDDGGSATTCFNGTLVEDTNNCFSGTTAQG